MRTMSKIELIILFCFSVNTIIGQNDTTINLSANWRKGDTKKYEINQFSTILADGKLQTSSKTTKEVTISVVNENDSLFEIVWKYDEIRFSDSVSLDNPFSDLMNNLNRGLVVRYKINKQGSIKSISNYNEISARISSMVDSTLELISKNKKFDKSDSEMLKFQFSMMFSTDQQIDLIVLSDVFKFHQLYGKSYTLNKITSIEDKIFAPSPGGPADSLLIKLISIDKSNSIYHLQGEFYNAFFEQMKNKMPVDQRIKHLYQFRYPGNWVFEFNSATTSSGFASINESYQIKIKE